MGTIVITEYGDSGHEGKREAPIANLNTSLKATSDTSTSTTVESLTLQEGTRYVSVYGAELHRVSTQSATATDKYEMVPAGQSIQVSTDDAATIYYRLDA